MTVTACLDAALGYAARGWYVFPVHGIAAATGACTCGNEACGSPGKHPLTSSGLDAGTTDQNLIRKWWAMQPEANVAIRTGPESGLVVLDFDGAEGVELANTMQALPSPRVTTGSGGRHWYFSHPGFPVGNRARVVPGLDVRADRGYVVAPSSKHVTGGMYVWDEGFSPAETDPAPIPEDILALLGAQKNPVIDAEVVGERDPGGRKDADLIFLERAVAYCAKIPGAVAGQSGHDQTFVVALKAIHGFGLSRRQAMKVLQTYNQRCQPPWNDKELAHKLDSAIKDARNPEALAVLARTNTNGVVSDDKPWMTKVQMRTGKGGLVALPIAANAVLYIAHDSPPIGKLRLDEFANRIMVENGGKLTPYGNAELNELNVWLQEEGRELYVGKEISQQGAEIVAHRNGYHPIRDYLASLTHDGTPRIDTWLIRLAGAKDDAYIRAVSSKWLVSAVARTFKPGCRADAALVFEGKQGIRKSTALAVLGGKWASGLSNAALHSKDAMDQLSGKWIVELAELDSLNRSEIETVKDFLSRVNDFYRPSYGRVADDHLRGCVFGGTTNSSEYLRDPTGGRRFWPIAIPHTIDTDGLAAERDQLWAEAVAKFYSGEIWHLTNEEEALAGEEQLARTQSDAWVDTIFPWLDGQVLSAGALAPFDVSISEVMSGALRIDPQHQGRADQIRVGVVLRHLGWIRYQARHGAARQWRYRQPAKNT